MDTSILEDIGLTGAEIKVFLSLLEIGSTSAGRVVEHSGLQNAVVHRAFHSLSQKGLITYSFTGRIKQYQTISPHQLLDFIDEKRARLERLLPELEAKRQQPLKEPRAVIYEGTRGVKELINLMIDTENTDYLTYGAPQLSHDHLGEFFWRRHHKLRVERKIRGKILFHSSLARWGGELHKRPLTTVRLTDESFEELTETLICGEKVAILMYLDKPFGFLIDESQVAQSYTGFFNLIWRKTKNIG